MDANVVVAHGVRHAKFDLAGVRTTGVPEALAEAPTHRFLGRRGKGDARACWSP